MIADNWIGNLGQSLYRADREVQEAFRSLLENHLDQINPFIVRLIKEGKLSSIRTLSVDSPALMALATIPPAVPFQTSLVRKLRDQCTLEPTAWSPMRAAISTAPNLKRSSLLVMKPFSTRTQSPRSSGYFACI